MHSEHIQELMLRCMFFANDIVLVEELRKETNGKSEMLRQVMEAHGFCLIRSKTSIWNVSLARDTLIIVYFRGENWRPCHITCHMI